MTTTTTVRVAQVGVGGFGAWRRARMRETGLFELVAAYDCNPEALARCQAEDGAKPVSSYEELLATPGIEAVIISTGAKFHAEQVIQAAEKGWHVFVEKPLCATPEELDALLAGQRKTGVVIGVGHHDHSHDAISLTVRQLIESGRLGKVATFEYTTAHSGGLGMKPADWRADPRKNPGGMLFQCGVHAVHEFLFDFGPIVRVSAMMRYDVHTTATADVAICHLQFASGLIGSLNAYHVTPYRETFSVFGTRANLYRDHRVHDEGLQLFLQDVTTDPQTYQEPKLPVEVRGETDQAANLRSFYRAIRDGTTPNPSLLDGARAVQVVFAAEESARTGKVVELRRLLP